MSNIIEDIINQDPNEAAMHSIKIGFCRAMSESGLSPKTAEALLEKVADGGKNPLGGLGGLAKTTLIGGAGLGAALGVGSAMVRRKMEKTIDGAETPEMRSTRAQINAYKRMITNFKEEQGLQSGGQGLV